jgi:hypothetical protein
VINGLEETNMTIGHPNDSRLTMLPLARRTSLVGRSLALAAVFLCSAVAPADPPDRVARLSFLSGSVSFRPATVDDWAVATLNYPTTTGDSLWTDAAGRAELQLGTSVVRLAANTSLSIVNLDNRVAQLRLAQGTLSVSVRDIDLPLGEVIEIDTPSGAVSLLQLGFYRIDVGLAGDQTTVTVRHGMANVATGTTAVDIGDNRSVVTGLAVPSDNVQSAVRTDEWEDWCQSRERRAENVMAQMYVSRDAIGYDDLDEFGAWENDAVYGPIWIPRVPADWAPYRFGHWVWIESWGWTWIDDAPWGFAPFHYGRWVTLRGGWAWLPGDDIFARPVYAPALVAFVAAGDDWRGSLGIDEPIVWFPLGPHEVFVPTYRVSPGYLRAINAAHAAVTDVNLTHVTYVNRTVPGAMTAMRRDAFVQGRPVAPVVVRVPAEVSRTASIVGTAAPVAPEAVSVLGQRARGVTPPASVLNRQVVMRTPPPPPPVPFATLQPALAAHPGQPVDEETLRSLQPRTPVVTGSGPLVPFVAAPAIN